LTFLSQNPPSFLFLFFHYKKMNFFSLFNVCESEGEPVDAVKLTVQRESMDNKENEDLKQKQEEELKKQQEAAEEDRRLAELALIEEQRRHQQEVERRQKEEELWLQQEQEKRHAEEQRKREEQRRIEAEARRAEEAKQREMEEKRRREKKKADDATLRNFLNENGGLTDVNDKKKGIFGNHSYPLHVAVKKNDAEIVRILLENKADKTLLSGSGKTALEKANKYNENDSHKEIIRLLSR